MRIATIIALVIFSVPLFDLYAQNPNSSLNIGGVWEGTMSHGTDGYSPTWNLTFVFEPSKDGGQIRGTTKIQAGDQFAVFSLRGTIAGRSLTATEGSILEEASSKMTGGWCMNRSIKLTLMANDKLEGTWSSPTSGCTGGSIVAARGAATADGQRDKAKQLACSAPSGSLGKEAICPNFDFWYVKMFGNQCAGGVGDLYQANKAVLEGPATDENIKNGQTWRRGIFESKGGAQQYSEAFSRGRKGLNG